MFEDETVDIACPKCGHKNPILVREFEQNAPAHFACAGCGVGLKIDADEFRGRLEQVRKELEELEREADEARRKTRRPRKGDFQI
jgi:peptide subunit release factor 1 (eRF1)